MKNIQAYLDFIEECKQRIPIIDFHKHHIIPRYMGGCNSSDNIIKLSYKDHKQAHLILASCYEPKTDHYNKNVWAARMIDKWTIEDASKWKTSSGMLNKKHTQRTLDKLSSASINMWNNMSNTTKKIRSKKLSDALINRFICDEWKQKRRETVMANGTFKGEGNPMFGKNHSQESKNKQSISAKKSWLENPDRIKPRAIFEFYQNNKLIDTIVGQKNAKIFCKENQISFQQLCKSNTEWREWKCKRNKKINK